MSAIVMCRVSGGVTGTREAPLKEGTGRNPPVKYFATIEEAKAEAARLNAREPNPHSLACFRYWAMEN